MSENQITENQDSLPQREKYLIFSVQDKLYSLPSGIISEAAVLEKVFPLPLVPLYVRGIINRYSVPYALIDIHFLLHKDSSNAKKIIVLKENIDKIALLIDDVTDIADISREELVKTEPDDPAVSGSINAFFEWKGRPVFCLDAEGLINWIKQDFEQQ